MKIPYYNFHKEHSEVKSDHFITTEHSIDSGGYVTFKDTIKDEKLKQEEIRNGADTNLILNALVIGGIAYIASK